MGHSSTLHITNITSTTHFVENNGNYCHFSPALTALNTVDIISAAPQHLQQRQNHNHRRRTTHRTTRNHLKRHATIARTIITSIKSGHGTRLHPLACIMLSSFRTIHLSGAGSVGPRKAPLSEGLGRRGTSFITREL